MNRTIIRGVKALRKAFSLKVNSKADTGIGTLIVFIAMVLVAAVAAAVLINTAGLLQTRAQTTGTQTTQQVSSGLSIKAIYGMDNNSSQPEAGVIEYMAIYVTPNSGSAPINLGNATITLTYENFSASLTYNSKAYNNVFSGTQNVFNTTYFKNLAAATGSSHFGILGITNPGNSITAAYPVLTTGDEAAILINVSAVFHTGNFSKTTVDNGISQGQQVTGTIVPQVGATSTISFTSPIAYTTRVVQLQ
ncbi:MAG: flagellin [Thermoplasmataceae archaeon]